MSKFTVAVIQTVTQPELGDTLRRAEEQVREAAGHGAQVVALPEMFVCPYSRHYFKIQAALGHEGTVQELSRWAREYGVLLVGGSLPEKEGEKLYNTCFVFDKQGNIIARHRKVHLFDVDAPGLRFGESDTFSPGSEITVFDTEFGRMGVAVCFDLRFPELFRAMAMRGAEVVFAPSQFNSGIGRVHWEPTLMLRAIDNEFYLVAPNAAANPAFRYQPCGMSCVIDPFGEKLCMAADKGEAILYARIDTDRVDEVRRTFPTFRRLREDVYEVAK